MLASPRSPPSAMDSSMAQDDNEVFEENQGKETNNVEKEGNPSSETMVTEQVGVKPTENIPATFVEGPESEMLVGSPVPVTEEGGVKMDETQSPLEDITQHEEGRSIETGVAGEMAVENENIDVKTEENVSDVLDEIPVSVMQDGMAEEQLEQPAQPKDGASVETEPVNGTGMGNENMETNQDLNKHDVDELVTVTVSDSVNFREEESKVEEQCGESTELALELMETDQVFVKEDCVTQQVTPVMSGDQEFKGDVTQGEVNDQVVDLNNQSDAAAEHTGLGQNDEAPIHASVAMEIDTQGETSEYCSVQKSEHATEEMQPDSNQLSETSLRRTGTNQLVNNGDASLVSNKATPVRVTDSETASDLDTNKSLVPADNSSTEKKHDSTPVSDT